MRAIQKPQRRKTVKGALRQMRKLLVDQRRWMQGGWFTTPSDKFPFVNNPSVAEKYGGICRMCVDGAIILCSANPKVETEVREALTKQLPAKFESLVGWNDAMADSVDDVARLIDKALVA